MKIDLIGYTSTRKYILTTYSESKFLVSHYRWKYSKI